jgi:hypothetical protein
VTQRTLSWVAAAVLSLLSTQAVALESGFYLGAIGGNASTDTSKSELDAFERIPFATGFSSSLDDSDTAVGIVLGGQLGKWFAVEAQIIDLGEYSYSATQTDPNVFASAPRDLTIRSETSYEAAAFTVSGILTVPVGEQVAFGFRLGFAASAVESRFSYQERRGNNLYYSESYDNDAEASDIDATFGVSVEWAPVRHFGVRLEYQRINQVGAEDDDYDYDYDFDDDYGDYYDGEDEHGGRDVDLISLSLIGRF